MSRVRRAIDRLASSRLAVLELAEVASLAARIEPALLRRLRLYVLPGLDAGTEADLWLSPLVETRNPVAMVLLSEAVPAATPASLCSTSACSPHFATGHYGGIGGVLSRDWVYGDATSLVTFLQNHDVGPDNDFRFRFQGDDWMAAAAYNMLWTIRGIPCLCQGEEVAFMRGAPRAAGAWWHGSST